MRRRTSCGLLAFWLAAFGSSRAADVGTAFTYQGNLVKNGSPVTNTCDFRFNLYDDPAEGSVVGNSPQTATGVNVSAGVLTTQIDFGVGAIDGTARWLAIEVQCPGDGVFIPLDPRVALTPSPHALALPGFYTRENGTSPNVIGGFRGNIIEAGVIGSSIGGGGHSEAENRITDSFCVIGGGRANQAGNSSGATNIGFYATVAGGQGNRASDFQASVGGGQSNTAGSALSTIGGGLANTTTAQMATISGGFENSAHGRLSVIGGGESNTAAGDYCTVGGGTFNNASGLWSSVVGGNGNDAPGLHSVVTGGEFNTASGVASIAVGGVRNAAGGDYSFAGGRRAKVRDAVSAGDSDGDEGTFVWADSTGVDFSSSGPNQFLIRASGGVGIGISIPNHPLQVGTGPSNGNGAHVTNGGVWTNGSDRNSKQGFEDIDKQEILRKVAGLPVTRWQYKGEPEHVRHVGPVAQDFYSAFATGADERYIGTIDADGVALAAIQGLYEVVQEKECEINELRDQKNSEILHLHDRISRLEAMVSALAAQDAGGGR